MGNDGGSIAKRIDLVREKKKEIRRDTVAINQNKSKYCAISNSVLQSPLVGCRLGYLYNKEALLSCLINKTMPKTFNHIRNLKDVKDLAVCENSNKSSPYPLVCPLSAVEYNGLTRFVFLWSCGCLLSERALPKVKSVEDDLSCPLCSTKFAESEVVALYLTPDEIDEKKQALMVGRVKKPEVKKDANIGVVRVNLEKRSQRSGKLHGRRRH